MRRRGGECLNTERVPSRAALASAKNVHGAREALYFSLEVSSNVDLARVRDHVRVLSQTWFLLVYTGRLVLTGCCKINDLALPSRPNMAPKTPILRVCGRT